MKQAKNIIKKTYFLITVMMQHLLAQKKLMLMYQPLRSFHFTRYHFFAAYEFSTQPELGLLKILIACSKKIRL